MALVQKQLTSKKQTVLTAVMLAVILATVLAAYFGYFRSSRRQPPPAPTDSGENQAPPVRPSGKSSLDLLDSLRQYPIWQRLKRFGHYPLPLAPRGNPAPFKLPETPPAQ